VTIVVRTGEIFRPVKFKNLPAGYLTWEVANGRTLTCTRKFCTRRKVLVTLGAFWMSRSAVAEVSIVTETKSNQPAVLPFFVYKSNTNILYI
jgi:hypothetical protein